MKTVAEIQELLASRKTEERIRAVKYCRVLEPEEAQPLLLTALRDKSNYVAQLAAELLGDIADSEALQKMVERFLWISESGIKRDSGCHIRAALAFAFGKKEYSLAYQALRIGIRTVQIEPLGGVPFDMGAHLRANCALSMAQLRFPESVYDISMLLFDDNPKALEPRKAAAQALARLAAVDSILPLAIHLTHPGDEAPEVIQECMQAVVELNDEHAGELLIPYLKHNDMALAAYAGLMLARMRIPGVETHLVELIPVLEHEYLEAILLALISLRTKESEAALDSLEENSSRSRREFIHNLRKKDTPSE